MKYALQQHGLGWRANLWHVFHNGLPDGDIYQFGVWDGFSMQVLGSLVRHLPTKNYARFFGFDVFTGMPTESNEPDKQRDTPGTFNLLKHYGVCELKGAISMLHSDISANMSGNSELIIIPGLVEQTLNDELVAKHQLKPAFYVDMDMDIYSPTKYVLNFMLEKKLIVEGTILGFDDWGNAFHNMKSIALEKAEHLRKSPKSMVFKSPRYMRRITTGR
jgi:hypothetical protein